MTRTRVTIRQSGPVIPDPQGAYLGFCARQHFEFTADPPDVYSEEAVAAQTALQTRYATNSAAAAKKTPPLAGLGALNAEPGVLLHLFTTYFPADQRARLALVHPTWACFLARPTCWQVLDLSASGVDVCCDKLLKGAAARACGSLHTLDVSACLWRLCIEARNPDPNGGNIDDCEFDDERIKLTDEGLNLRRYVSTAALLSVLAANSRSLRVLRAICTHELCDAPVAAGLRPPQLHAILAAAPGLTSFLADIACMLQQASPLLRNEGVYAPVRVRRLALCGHYREHENDDPRKRPEGDDHILDASLVSNLAAHASLTELELDRVHFEDVQVASSLASTCRNIRALRIHGADGPASEDGYMRQEPALPADTTLAALLPPLLELSLQLPTTNFDANEARRLAKQLLAAQSLQKLSLAWPGESRTEWPDTLWVPYHAPEAALSIVAGLAGHPTLRRLWLRDFPIELAPRGAVTAPAILRTVTMHSPALEVLHISGGRITHDDDQQRVINTVYTREFLSALAAAQSGAPALRHLSVPWEGLGGLTAAKARAAAPALHTLTLLLGDDEGVKQYNAEGVRRGRGAVRRWLPGRTVLNDSG